jgi:hypothetical protein
MISEAQETEGEQNQCGNTAEISEQSGESKYVADLKSPISPLKLEGAPRCASAPTTPRENGGADAPRLKARSCSQTIALSKEEELDKDLVFEKEIPITLSIIGTEITLDANFVPFAVGMFSNFLTFLKVFIIHVETLVATPEGEKRREWNIFRRYNQFHMLDQQVRR